MERFANLRRLSSGGARFELAERSKHFGEGGLTDFMFELILQAVESGNDAEGATLALRLEGEPIGSCIAGIDLTGQKALGFEGRDAVTEIAASGGEGFGQLRWFDVARGLEEERGEDERFMETEVVCGKDAGGEGLETPGGPSNGEHGALKKKGIDAHR